MNTPIGIWNTAGLLKDNRGSPMEKYPQSSPGFPDLPTNLQNPPCYRITEQTTRIFCPGLVKYARNPQKLNPFGKPPQPGFSGHVLAHPQPKT